MKQCPKCKNNHNKPGVFCSRKCANSREWNDEHKKKVSESVNAYYMSIGKLPIGEKKCEECEKKFQPIRHSGRFCSPKCAMRNNWKHPDYRSNITEQNKERCSDKKERDRLREIGRKGGFGTKGYTKKGIYYQSKFEKNVFEWLDDNGIVFEPHKLIPNCSKISDLYIPQINYWFELDGINREKRQKWLKKEYKYWVEKLEEYKRNNLNLIVVYSLKEFIEKFNRCVSRVAEDACPTSRKSS